MPCGTASVRLHNSSHITVSWADHNYMVPAMTPAFPRAYGGSTGKRMTGGAGKWATLRSFT
jgi:hypothetical protein